MLASALVLALVIQTIVGNPVEDQRVDYSQHKLIRIRPQETSQLYRLEELRQEFDGRVDYWNHPMTDMRPVLSLISPSGISFLNALNSSNIKYEIAANNFQTLIDSEMEQNQRNKMLSTFAFDYDTVYHTYAEILAELKALPSQSSNVKYIRVGTTYQGREIGGITISNGNNLPAFILECGIHAREWVTPAACLWIANQLITNSAESKYLSRFNWVIVPSLNSDGYYYTWNNDRMWRKTRSPQGTCYGVDPNRNWNAAHCQTGASTSPCSDTYCGPSPFSESEVKAMADLVTSYGSNIAAYISVHSYSELWMYPYGYSTSLKPSNEAQLSTLTNAAIAAVKATGGNTWVGGPIATTIYVSSGSSIDWTYDKAGVKVSFALELRDTGRYGFQLPPDQILPASQETWAGIKAIADGI